MNEILILTSSYLSKSADNGHLIDLIVNNHPGLCKDRGIAVLYVKYDVG